MYVTGCCCGGQLGGPRGGAARMAASRRGRGGGRRSTLTPSCVRARVRVRLQYWVAGLHGACIHAGSEPAALHSRPRHSAQIAVGACSEGVGLFLKKKRYPYTCIYQSNTKHNGTGVALLRFHGTRVLEYVREYT